MKFSTTNFNKKSILNKPGQALKQVFMSLLNKTFRTSKCSLAISIKNSHTIVCKQRGKSSPIIVWISSQRIFPKNQQNKWLRRLRRRREKWVPNLIPGSPSWWSLSKRRWLSTIPKGISRELPNLGTFWVLMASSTEWSAPLAKWSTLITSKLPKPLIMFSWAKVKDQTGGALIKCNSLTETRKMTEVN